MSEFGATDQADLETPQAEDTEGTAAEIGREVVSLAEEMEEGPKMVAGEKPEKKGAISRAEFLTLPAVFLAAALGGRQRNEGKSMEGDLPLSVKVAVAPVLGWIGEAQTSAARQRRGLLAILGLGLLAAAGGVKYGLVEQRKTLEKKAEVKKQFDLLPQDQKEELRRRNEAERNSPLFGQFKGGSINENLNPFNIKNPLIRRLTIAIGPTWMFIPERADFLELWFGRKFREDEIREFRINPDKREDFFRILEGFKSSGRINQEVIDFYRRPPD